MLERIWTSILEFMAQLVTPDWGVLIALLLPVETFLLVIVTLLWLFLRLAKAPPAQRGKSYVTRPTPPGIHMPGPSFAPVFAGVGVFLAMQLIDYSLLGAEGLSLSSGQYGTTYYTLTGFHGAHVFGGVLMLGVVMYRGMAGQFSGKHHDMVEAASLYWHFVDVVWILLFSILYLL